MNPEVNKPMKKTLTHMTQLEIQSPDGSIHIGGLQDWYGTIWQRRAGCGPTTASNLIWYLSKTQTAMETLCQAADSTQASFLILMETVFNYITPGRGGVNTTRIFTDGAIQYGLDRNVPIGAQVLDIPMVRHKRPTPKALGDFILDAINDDLPVAFLNLSNGALKNLDTWHWVTILGMDTNSMWATICDQGLSWDIDLAKWLKTTVLGGGMVYLNHSR
jgi:hypothetical protein